MESIMNDKRCSGIVLETNRLILRRLSSQDIEYLVSLWTDPGVTKYMGGPREKEYLIRTFKEDLNTSSELKYDLWPAYNRDTKEFVGHCGLLDKEVNGITEIEVNYILDRAQWGKGYATEIASALLQYGFREYGLKRLIALIDPGNTASEKVAVKIGMHLEGELARGHTVKRLYTIERECDFGYPPLYGHI